ncbi:hypothetical protein KUTeg_010315, partial [Tegillarca granosa]
MILMAVYWTTEAFPLPVTAMLPVIVFPMMGVSKVKTLAREYYTDITFVFLGGLSVAVAIEKWNVHRRFALRLLLLMGFMLTTSFLSMWVSNTATTSMMIPIAQAVLVQLFKTKELKHLTRNQTEEDHAEAGISTFKQTCLVNPTSTLQIIDDHIDFKKLNAEDQRLCKAVSLCICYAANCGGVGTLTGTGPNLVMKGQADLLAGGKSGITFLTWFVFSFPVAFINVIISWIVLQIMFFGWSGLLSFLPRFAEKAVLFHFILMILLWFTLDPEFAPGWGSFFPHGYLSDAVPATIILFMLFIFPSRRRNKGGSKEIPPLLDWQILVERLPWGVQILLGGGFALARACRAMGIHVHPIYIMLPSAISTSFAFMLPVATPPNTIVFSYGYLKVIDMVKIGFVLNLLCVVV